MFGERDMQEMNRRGIDPAEAKRQIDYFRTGFPFLPIEGAAVPGNGIERLDDDRIKRLIEHYDACRKELSVVKFVPASGAASRMFKEMYEFVNEGKESDAVRSALAEIGKFAFYEELKAALSADADDRTVIENIVGGVLGYGRAPKALILFHRYADGSRTAFEEHLAEGAMYAASGGGTVRIHFTISPEHETGFRRLEEKVRPEAEKKYGIRYEIGYSRQKPGTDTIAVDMDNEPFREPDGSILFRPGGHGALLENLNDIDADLIFIKTVDNVCPDRMKPETVIYKKALAGLLLELQETGFGFLKALKAGADEETVRRAADFVRAAFHWKPGSNFDGETLTRQAELLIERLDRPIRVCGMVKNEGEPGGGPFRVREADGSVSLQIAESSQIAPGQKHLMREATHFNPVDLVCGVYDSEGRKYDLRRFVDPLTGFISSKSKDGRGLKALELPGLWNGAMARWNTVFVEVPVSTFNPVKTVNDLLRPQHR